MKRIHVAVGVIINDHNQILLAKRHGHLHQGGKWEFPGGKVESMETISQALIRELKEEVDLDVINSEPLMQLSHDYPDKQVLLDIHIVKNFTGKAKGVEGQPIEWVAIEALTNYDFPEANKPIVQALLKL